MSDIYVPQCDPESIPFGWKVMRNVFRVVQEYMVFAVNGER